MYLWFSQTRRARGFCEELLRVCFRDVNKIHHIFETHRVRDITRETS